MINHITNAEWLEYFSGGAFTPERLRLLARVHAHIGSCEQCRELHRRRTRMASATSAMEPRYAAPNAYRAVADETPSEKQRDWLTVLVEMSSTGGHFLFSTLYLEGDFEKYVFLPEEDSPRLTDECDPNVWMALDGGALQIRLPKWSGLPLRAVLREGDQVLAEQPLSPEGAAELPLPASARGTLMLDILPDAEENPCSP